ncbi:elongation factor 1-beta [Candidatus Woesearchaeota archaeon]|nr:elongation factor 1-beta [Candidatus Woesearchaeota archaeon]
MADVIVTIKVMPESPEEDLKHIEQEAKKLIEKHDAILGKVEIKPIAFGLNSLNLIMVMDESKGSTEELEKKIAAIKGVISVDVIDVRRAVG